LKPFVHGFAPGIHDPGLTNQASRLIAAAVQKEASMGYHVTGLTHVSRSSQPISKPHLKRRVLLVAFAVFVLAQFSEQIVPNNSAEARRSDLLNAPATRHEAKPLPAGEQPAPAGSATTPAAAS
jgi:hypothetical protein